MRKWLPQAPQGSPGVWYDLQNMVPLRSGAYYIGSPLGPITGDGGHFAGGTTRRAWCALLPDDSVVAYVGTTTTLYQLASNSAPTTTDRSRGGGYTAAADWSFAQFGKISLASDRVDAMQFRDATTATAFADLAGAPKASILVTQAQQIIAFDLNDGAEKPDYFATCAPGDYTDWASAGATLPTPIWHRPGKIVAAIAFRDYVLAFKKSSVYKLTYTGNTASKWKVELIAIGRGCFGKHDVVNCGDIVVFHGPGGAWTFDGASFRSITDYFGELCGGFASMGSLFSPTSQNVFFFGANLSLGSYNAHHVYNIVSDRWGSPTFFIYDGGSPIAGAHVPLTGEPAALRAFILAGISIPLPDYYWLINTQSSAYSYLQAALPWNNSGQQAAQVSYIVGGIEGIGDRAMTNFSGLDLELTIGPEVFGGYSPPAPTALQLDIYTGDSRDDINLASNRGGITPTQSNVSSSTKQKRFDFNQSAPYARFKIKFPVNGALSAEFSYVNDYTPRMQDDGEL